MLAEIQQQEQTIMTWIEKEEYSAKMRRCFPDITTRNPNKQEKTEEEKAEAKQKSIDECGRAFHVPDGHGGRKLRWKFCHNIHDCDNCNHRYQSEAIKDLDQARSDLGNLWVVDELLSLDDWRAIRYDLESAPNTCLIEKAINKNSPQHGRKFNLFYLRTPVSDTQCVLIVGCQDRPQTKRITNWRKIEAGSLSPHSDTLESMALYTKFGRKSGRLSNYRKYFGEYKEKIVIKLKNVSESEDLTTEVLDKMFGLAVEKTKDLQLLIDIAPDRKTELQYRIELIEAQSELFANYCIDYGTDHGFEVTGITMPVSYLIDELLE